MRVVGGAWRGRPLRAPAGRGTRPTSDKVREAVFGILLALPAIHAAPSAMPGGAAPDDVDASGAGAPGGHGALANHVALDLFAGSGALGIEALSRGAAACTFVEAAAPAVRVLRQNLAAVGALPLREARSSCGGARIVVADVRRALSADARRAARYTLVFADPPYDRYAQVRPVLARLLGRVLAPGAVLVVETAAGTAAGLPWPVVRERRYGGTLVTVLVADDAAELAQEAGDDEQRSGC